MRRAERAGFKAIALTVDTPRLGRREADIKNRSAGLALLCNNYLLCFKTAARANGGISLVQCTETSSER